MLDSFNDVFYYTSDGNRFNNKSLAFAHARLINSSIYWYYFDKQYDMVDWKTEPKETLSTLYKERAQQLRDSYTYIVLCYSGGYDSSNILQTCIDNNIFIDEIVIAGAFSKDREFGSDENHNGEVYYNVYPKLKELSPRTKINVIDYTIHFNELELVRANDIELISNLNTHHSPHNYFWSEINKFILSPKEKTAIIFGCDKPSIRFANNKFVNYFVDVSHATYGYHNRKMNELEFGTHNVNFYSHPDAAKITVKQCHLIKNVYETLKSHPNPTTLYDQLNTMHVEQYQNFIPKIIYPNINLNFRSPKSKNLLLSLRDNYILKDTSSSLHQLHKRYLVERLKKRDYDILTSKYYELS